MLRIAALLAAVWLLSAPVAHAQVGAIDRLQDKNDARNDELNRLAGAGADAPDAADGDENEGEPDAEDESDEGAAEGNDEEPGDGDAADGEPAKKAAPVKRVPFDKWDDNHSILRSKAPALSWLKLTLVGLMLLFWVRTGDWINRDVNEHELGYPVWSVVALVPGMVGGLLCLFLPFLAAFPLLVVACVGPLIAYAVHHNKSVEPHERVFTVDWFRFVMAETLSKVGVKVKTEKKAGYMAGAPVELVAAGDDERTQKANLLTARQSPGYVLVKDLVAEMVDRGSNRVMLDYTQQGVTTKQQIDGVWHTGEPMELESGNVMLAVMKQLAALNAKDRRSKQQGGFSAEYKKTAYQCAVASQGTKTGERVVVTLAGGAKKKFRSYDDIGLRPKLAEEWGGVMAESTGLIVFSGLPEGGLTTLTDVALLETDRLMRDFVAIEEESKPEQEMENIEQVFYNARAGESPATLMPKLIRKYPDVYVVRDFVDADSGKALMEQAADGKLVITSTPARDAAEAVLRVAQKAPLKPIAQTLIGSIGVKLIRTLCTECRVEFEPSPDLLKKLGIPAGKVELLYREPKGEEAAKPCKACGGIGFRGRTALFELLIPDDTVRETLLTAPKPDALRKAGRAAGMRSFQEEGILLIAKGATSLSELQRVLKS